MGADHAKSHQASEKALEEEIDTIVRTIEGRGALSRDELARATNARYWAPDDSARH